MKISCKNCHKIFVTSEKRRKFCSRICVYASGAGQFKQSHTINLGKKMSEQSRINMKLGQIKRALTYQGDKHWAWKGDNAGYQSVHYWVKTRIEKTKCQHCGTLQKKNVNGSSYLQIANISGKYIRDISDWIVLCPKCHKRFDLSKPKQRTFLIRSVSSKVYETKRLS